MRIIFISTYPPTKCGIADYTCSLKESLSKRGLKTEIVNIKKRNSANPLYFIGLAKEAIVKSNPGDIMHVQFQLMMFGRFLWFLPGFYIVPFLIWLKKFGKSRIAITLHDIPSFKDAREMGVKWMIIYKYYEFIYYFIRKLCDKIIVHSENGRNILLEEWNFKEKNVLVIPLGLPDKAKILDKRLCKKKLNCANKKIILIFGYARGFKDYRLVLRALKELDNDVVLIITGGLQIEKHKKVYDDILRIIKKSDLNGRVKILGFVKDKDLPILFSAADIGILPYTKTFGDFTSAAMAEQIAYQIPILAADIHPFESFKEHNKCIETFSRYDLKDLLKKIKEILYNEKKTIALRKKEKAYWEKNRWEKIGEITFKAYKSFSEDSS